MIAGRVVSKLRTSTLPIVKPGYCRVPSQISKYGFLCYWCFVRCHKIHNIVIHILQLGTIRYIPIIEYYGKWIIPTKISHTRLLYKMGKLWCSFYSSTLHRTNKITTEPDLHYTEQLYWHWILRVEYNSFSVLFENSVIVKLAHCTAEPIRALGLPVYQLSHLALFKLALINNILSLFCSAKLSECA